MMDMQEFYRGASFDDYRYFGAQRAEKGFVFRTFAPNAAHVGLLLNGTEFPMSKIYDGNVYELHVGQAAAGDVYEFRIYHRDGSYTDHCDPYGFQMQLRPAHKSIVCEPAFVFSDGAWMQTRTERTREPLQIYEMHFGSWRKPDGGGWYRYDELAQPLIAYLLENGYNYVEFLPLSEHPCDESWGYQNTGFFAATSRYGAPQQLMFLINELHKNKIGAILDFVPVHFAVDDYGLRLYDGTALYEYPNTDVGKSEWGSCNFIHSRGEVRSFLQSAADFWLNVYHFDGLRMDAVSRMIYWQGDERRGVNGAAVDFIKGMNRGLRRRNRGVMLIAEDSTNYPNITKPVGEGGLGFDYKWDMGWMHDTLSYFQSPPVRRPDLSGQLTFSMDYFYNERYLLALSHDEVVHGKATILQKMNGEYSGKFPQARALYLYMMIHPGKKLNFMGNEIGQLREWDEKREQDWEILRYPAHDGFRAYIRRLNAIYLEHPALWETDFEKQGFAWLDRGQTFPCVYAVRRSGGGETLAALFNFSDEPQDYALSGLHSQKRPEMLLHSDWEAFGGKIRESEKIAQSISLPAFSGVLLRIEE